MTLPFNENFIAVGTTNNNPEFLSGVVVVVQGVGKFTMTENTARKLADDIIRNANHLWPESPSNDTE